MSKQTEALKLALEALEYISSHYMSLPKIGCMALAAVEEALAEQSAQQEQGDSNCQDADGCPTEMAVLQRFWRGEPIPTEHYPVWFRPAQQQEPVAWYHAEDYKTHFTSIPSEDLIESGYWKPLYTSPQRKPWVGLTDCEREKLRWQALEEDAGYTQLIKATEAKLREKNHG